MSYLPQRVTLVDANSLPLPQRVTIVDQDGNSIPADVFAADNSFFRDPDTDGTNYTRATLTYNSTFDDGVTSLSLRYSYNNAVLAARLAASERLEVCYIMHGYANDRTAITDADLDAYADYGLFAVALGLRGQNGATGSRDADGRNDLDILDAKLFLQAHGTIGPKISQGQHMIGGYSGGGGNALMCAIKFPSHFKVCWGLFPLTDKGYRAVTGWYYFYAGAPALLDVDVGARADTSDPYLARDVIAGMAPVLRLEGGAPFVEFAHGEDDVLVSPDCSAQLNQTLLDAGVPSARWAYRAEAAGVLPHGHRSDSALIAAQEKHFSRRLAQTADYTFPTRGSLRILGYFVGSFSIFLGPSGNPKHDLTGGVDKVADVDFDTVTGIFKITPITRTGDMVVFISLGSTVKRRLITDGQPIFVEMYGLATAEDGIELLIDASQISGFANNATVSSFREASKNAFLYSATGTPKYKTAGNGIAGGPSLYFDGSSRFVHAAPAITTVTKLSIAFIAQTNDVATRHYFFHVGNNASNGFGFAANHALDGKWSLSLSANLAVYSTAAACDTNPHLFILTYDGAGNWAIYIDLVADSFPTPPIAYVVPTTNDVLGAYSNAGAFPLNTGHLSYLEIALGVNWSADERQVKHDALKAIWTSLT